MGPFTLQKISPVTNGCVLYCLIRANPATDAGPWQVAGLFAMRGARAVVVPPGIVRSVNPQLDFKTR